MIILAWGFIGKLLTLGAHTQEGCSSQFVCLSVTMLTFTPFVYRPKIRYYSFFMLISINRFPTKLKRMI